MLLLMLIFLYKVGYILLVLCSLKMLLIVMLLVLYVYFDFVK